MDGTRRVIQPYNRAKAVEYAHRWAFGRNPKYFNFDKLGGDCTNFASQVLFAGSNVMNFTPTYGWYYIDANRRTPSWTGVNYLYNFLVNNKGAGPYAVQSDVKDIQPGDIIQLSFGGAPNVDHSPVVVKVGSPVSLHNILVAAHTYDRDYYPITNYDWADIRFIHILGVRT